MGFFIVKGVRLLDVTGHNNLFSRFSHWPNGFRFRVFTTVAQETQGLKRHTTCQRSQPRTVPSFSSGGGTGDCVELETSDLYVLGTLKTLSDHTQ